MQETVGDIWQVATPKDVVVVPTNVGWTSTGKNVMGRGLARDAARRWPQLPQWYGAYCQECATVGLEVYPLLIDLGTAERTKPNWKKWCHGLVLFPVKGLNRGQPWLSWRADASLDLIRAGLVVLATLPDIDSPWVREALFLVPSLGCGNGNLAEANVVPEMHRELTSDRFVHVRQVRQA